MKKRKSNKIHSKDSKNIKDRKVTIDAFSNVLARLGANTQNLLEGTDYPMTRLTQNFQLMNSLYRSHWIVRKIIDCIPEDMTRNWITIKSQLSPEDIKRFNKLQRTTRIQSDILEGLKWGRLYGGAAAVIIIQGHEDMLDKKLDYDMIMPGSFKGMIVTDRWCGLTPGDEIIEDLGDPDFGLPEYYYWSTETGENIKVHHSRVLRFIGRELPNWEKYTEQQWGASEIEVIFDELKKRDNTSWNIAQLIFLANLRVLKMNDLGELLALGDEESQKDLYNTVQAQNWLMSNMGMYILNKDDDFSTHQYTFSGLNDIYESFMLDVAGASEIPVTRLFGRSPAGFNATGESDMKNYYDVIEQKQASQLQPVLDKLLPIMFMSEFGAIPDDLDYECNPIGSPSESELSDIVDKKCNSIINVFNSGLISQKIALKELRQMSETTGMFTNVTDEDIANADDDADITGDMPPNENDSLNFNLPSSDGIKLFDGGEGSGNFGHEGRPGQIGGSGEGGKSNIDDLKDDEQFEKIKGLLGNKGPNTIEEFKDLKYNNSNKWEMLIQSYKKEYAREYIRSNEQPKSLNIGQQNKHLKGTHEYNQKVDALKKKGQYGPSYISIDNNKISELIKKYSGSGDIILRKGQWSNTEIILNNDEIVGKAINNLNGKEADTTVFKIHYGKDGTHIVPDYPSKKKGFKKK